MTRTTTRLVHNKIELALHRLRGGHDDHHRPLLLLHALGARTPDSPPAWTDGWAGPVYGLDFTGHGDSTVPRGGGYSGELLLADADTALAEVGPCTVVGSGLGAYVALMLAGSRPELVRGAVLADGPGLAGGPTGPTSQAFVALEPRASAPDPYALFELSRDLRPPDYATLFVRLAVEGSGMDEPIAVSAVVRPPWLAAVVDEVGVVTCSLADALVAFAQ